MSQLLQQLIAELQASIGGGNTEGLGFTSVPTSQKSIKYLFIEPALVDMGKKPYWCFPKAQKTDQPNQAPDEALQGILRFVNLVDVIRGGKPCRKCEFWIEAGPTTYVLELGWENDQSPGKLHNTTKSFLKALSTLKAEELKRPITIALQRLIDSPNYKEDITRPNPYAHKVVFMQVWKNTDEQVYDEVGVIDVVAAQNIIISINNILTGQAILTPRPKKEQQLQSRPLVAQEQVPQQAMQMTQEQYQQFLQYQAAQQQANVVQQQGYVPAPDQQTQPQQVIPVPAVTQPQEQAFYAPAPQPVNW